MGGDRAKTARRKNLLVRGANDLIALGLVAYLLAAPGVTVLRDLGDPHLDGPGIPRAAVRLFDDLTPRFEEWASERVAAGRAAELGTDDISGTEWPLFGSVFYLWSVEAMQRAWDGGQRFSELPPKERAHGAIDAAVELVVDPRHATWVKDHWGDDHLHRENAFYRMLVISAITAQIELTGESRHRPLLRDQVDSLSREIDAAPFGLIDDYPDQCYPTDVLAAIAAIRRADRVLGTDHSEFARRARRGFEGGLVDPLGLPPYMADSKRGEPDGGSRGCSNSYACIFSAEIWPDRAAQWYSAYERHFWQARLSAVGFREYPESTADDFFDGDVDAGPVLAGFGFAACAFGAGAARVAGRFDHAYPLAAEMIAISWPLPDGRLALPRLLSNSVDAPYLGEAAILFTLTRQPAEGIEVRRGGEVPGLTVILVACYFGLAALAIIRIVYKHLRWRRRELADLPPVTPIEIAVWVSLVGAGLAVAAFASAGLSALLLLCMAQLLPRRAKARSAHPV
jgi:hypothetical protein